MNIIYIIQHLRGGESIVTLFLYFLAGFFAWNAVPHLVKGITGQSHMTPFKKVSSPELNIVWSFINVLIAAYILGVVTGTGGFVLPWTVNPAGTDFWAFIGGGFVCALYLANFWKNPNAKLPWMK